MHCIVADRLYTRTNCIEWHHADWAVELLVVHEQLVETMIVNPFNTSCSKLLLFEGSSTVLV